MGGMRSFAIRGDLAAVALAALLFLWFFTAQWCSMLVDRVHTAPMAVVQSSPFGWNGTYLQFGSAIPGLVGLQGFNRGELLTGAHLLELTGPGPDYKQAATLEINANNQLILVAGGRSFVLGYRVGTIQGDDEPIPAFAAEPGDTTSVPSNEVCWVGQRRSAWPGPILSGPTTTWLRDLYYRLSWIKDSGARLDMVWRCEQGYEAINGWHNFGFAELIRIDIRPAPPSQPGHQ